MQRDEVPPARPGAQDDADLIVMVQSLPVGDRQREAAFEELVRRYQPLVHSYAMRYLHSPEPQEELVQAGYIGLLSAINNFDPSLGSSLLAYARPCISGEIKRHFRDKRWQVRVRRAAQELRAEVLKCEADLTQELSRRPTEAEIAARLQLSEDEVDEARRADRAFHALSLDAPFSADPDAGTLGEVLPDDHSDDLDKSLSIDAVWTHMPELPEREQYILSLRFFGNMTQSQIGECLGISQMHVSRLLAHALRFLKERILSQDEARRGAS